MTANDVEVLLKLAALEAEQRPRIAEGSWHETGSSWRRTQAGARIIADQERREHGPRISELHRDGYDDSACRRVSRCLARLEGLGLVVRWGWGANLTHVKLTVEGRTTAARLARKGPRGKGGR